MELFSIDKQAILLLSAYFGDSGNKNVDPLTPTEYGRFADWLLNNSMRPGDLLSGNLHEKLKDLSDKKITLSRLKQLLSRGASMSLSIEKWDRTGSWVLT
ncbi:MAG: DNA-processing protein DprA, partial [Ignavibacteriae bacterium]